MLGASAEDVVTMLRSILSEGDKALMTDRFGEFLLAEIQTALEPGYEGWLDDDLAFVRHWGFELRDIAVPVQIWQGAEDRMVPYAHGEWLAAHVPGADSHLLPEDGHLTVTHRVGEVHAWLLERF
jgi:pimeloyl-ACP methyl ester carboxylesterase